TETDQEVRSKWICYLEFNYNKEAIHQMKWSQVDIQMKHTKVLTELIKSGISPSLRPPIWMRASKGLTLKVNSNWTYSQLCDLSNHVPSLSDKQISRVLPTNACFMSSTSVGIGRLRRILRVIKWLQKNGTTVYNMSRESVNLSVIAAYLLLVCEEEDAFWLTLSIANELKSFSHQKTLTTLIGTHCPQIDEILRQHDIELSLITSHWFSALFAAFIPETRTLLHLWDLYFYFGSIVLFQITLGLLVCHNHSICEDKDSANVFNSLSDLPSNIKDLSSLLLIWSTGEKFIQYLNPSPTQSQISDNSSIHSSSLSLPSFNAETYDTDLKTKNIRQTSIIVELHEAIEAIGRHFEVHEPSFHSNLIPDYSVVDNNEDDEEYNQRKQRMRQKRAKALIDFQRHDSDELGFRKNDIITIVSERDEHCWVGELNGLRGWFPAKFVEILDERNRDYSIAGDDRVIPFINDLIRGRLYNAIKTILTYGMKKTLFVTTHPWIIIETISKACAESDFNSVYSRLVLTRTFRLDEFARVLTPSELLYRSIAHINHTHENEAMDVKLRSLLCIALNQNILHEWFAVICANQPHIISKWYHNWSFVNSPVWKMIKSELSWVGELNGLRGWFPAKFVEILDERNRDYSIAGDDRVIPFINDLIRGRLYNAIKTILTYGMKKTLFVTTHPWIIIETISKACAESDFNSVYSRLVLTRTFRLDEFARVLTPSELLYRSIAHINHTHENEAMDVKLRSLLCIALNQNILHEWFAVICANQPHIISKWYHNWSFVNSPVWKMIKSELRLLTQFSFNLNPNSELAESIQPKSPVSKDGVRDMLVKHHLFSWDI
ncbi:unnamed protein product, partial [Medioppia subpectinata]